MWQKEGARELFYKGADSIHEALPSSSFTGPTSLYYRFGDQVSTYGFWEAGGPRGNKHLVYSIYIYKKILPDKFSF